MSIRHVVLVLALALFWVARPAHARAAEPPTPEDPAPVADATDDTADDEPTAPDDPADSAAYQGAEDELEQRAPDQQLAPSLSADTLRAMVRAARTKVLAHIEHKMEVKDAARMTKLRAFIGWFSLAGLALLAMPLVLRRRFPGQGARLFKYSALAAVTFFVTVNLFGVVVLGFRTAQGALGTATNPQLHIASGFFDSIDRNADEYLVMGKELFVPTLEQLQGSSDEQPAAILIENGQKLVKDAQVFGTVATTFKKLDVVFGLLPMLLLLVTMVLFVLAIRPTLVEIVRLPITAASGQANAGATVVKRALRRVGGELLATLCTIGVLVGLTLLAGAILGHVVGPALDALIGYFALGISYLQFVHDASSGLVFVMLASVLLFLVLNLAVVIASMAMFLGKAQKIFQRRFNDGVALGAHARFWRWGVPAVVLAQLLPWLYIAVASFGLDKLDDHLTAGVTDASQVPWHAIMLAGPLLLVGGFVLTFWALRGFKALAFLATYKVPPAARAV